MYSGMLDPHTYPNGESFDSVRGFLNITDVLKLTVPPAEGELRNTGREWGNEEARISNRTSHKSNIPFYIVTIVKLKRGQIT